MSKLLKGNFEPRKKVEVVQAEEGLESKFEREALKNLGGSIAFVAKKKVAWNLE